MLPALLLCWVVSAAAEFSCEHKFPDGSFVNLTALLRGPADLNYASTDVDGFKYTMNVCGVDSSNQKCLQTNSMICQFTPSGTFKQSIARWGVGQPPEWSHIEGNQGVVAKFSNGDSCVDPDGQLVESIALLAFTCSASAGEKFTVGHMKNPCVFTITFPTAHACSVHQDPIFAAHAATAKAKAHSWSFTAFVMIFFLCYCCVGCLWRFKHEDARGLDMIPHLSFWSGLVSSIADFFQQLVAIVRHKVEKFRSGRRDSNGQYEEVETIPFDDTDNNL